MMRPTIALLLFVVASHASALRALPNVAHLRTKSPPICSAAAAPTPRWRDALPCKNDALDKKVLDIALPSIANLAIIPIVGAVDTFWVGQMGDALALAGQGAANQCFFSTYFLIAFIPTITAPLVAKAAGGGDREGAAKRIAEALFLANVLGIIGTLLLVFRPQAVLGMVLPAGAPAAAYATDYLRLRSLSLVPALLSSVGFAAFRGLLDNVTPLKISLASNLLNLILDPILIFGANLGVAGAAIATAASEVFAGLTHVTLLLRRGLLKLRQIVQPPKLAALLPLIAGGAAMLMRQLALNVAFVAATRMTQRMDATGVAAAAYAITNQVYSLGVVVMLAFQATGATVVPSALAAGDTEGGMSGQEAARRVADRLIGWGTLIAAGLAAAQYLAMPLLTPLFTPLAEVRTAVARPAAVAALVQLTNGFVFAGEGIMMGLGAFAPLAILTSIGVSVMVAGLAIASRAGGGVASVWAALLAFHVVQAAGTMIYHFKLGPLATSKSQPAAAVVECVAVPVVGEVCVETSEDGPAPEAAAAAA